MDPNETWELMIAAYHVRDPDLVREHAQAMLQWLRSGGFGPNLTVGLPDGSLCIELESSFHTRAIAESMARNLLSFANHQNSVE